MRHLCVPTAVNLGENADSVSPLLGKIAKPEVIFCGKCRYKLAYQGCLNRILIEEMLVARGGIEPPTQGFSLLTSFIIDRWKCLHSAYIRDLKQKAHFEK